jgi:hypothetical protein
MALVRRAVSVRPAREFEIAPLDIRAAADAVCLLHGRVRQLDGHKFAVALVRVSDQVPIGVAICSQPLSSRLADGLTTELRALAWLSGTEQHVRTLLDAVVAEASSHGYRRVLAPTSDGVTLPWLMLAGWCPLIDSAGSTEQGATGLLWKVVRGELRFR